MCHEILTENLGMHRFAFKMVPCLPSEDQKQNRVDVSKELVECANADENFKRTSSQVMKLGLMAMISKQKSSLRNGSLQSHPDPKKHRKFSPMWK
jgi:hypothetical protein